MSKAKQLMQKAHRESGMSARASVSVTSSAKPLEPSKVETHGVKDAPRSQRPPAPPAQSRRVVESASTPISQIARKDLTVEDYGINPWKSNFNIYNKEIVEFVRNFSSSNQLSGGSAITKSQMIEVMLDVMFYDLGIRPIGFESAQDLREHLQEKLRMN